MGRRSECLASVLPSDFIKADLWVVPAGNSFEDDFLIVDNPALEEVLGMFPVELHDQISSTILERLDRNFYGLIISPVWPKGRMALMQVDSEAAIVVGCTTLLWWMLEHDQARVHIILPTAPKWVRRFENLTVWDYEGKLQSEPRPRSQSQYDSSAPRKAGARNRNTDRTRS